MLRLGLEWSIVPAVIVTLIAGQGTLAKSAIWCLVVFGAGAATTAFWEHGWLRLRSPGRAASLVAVAWASMGLLGWYVYPPGNLAPTSDLRVVQETIAPFQTDTMPSTNLWIMNDSPYTRRATRVTLTAIGDETPSMAALAKAEERLWSTLQQKFENNPSPPVLDLPPKVTTTITIDSTHVSETRGRSLFLTSKQASDLQTANGLTIVFFMAIFDYVDENGEHHQLDYCTFSQGKAIVRCTNGHNGPAKPSRH